MLVGQVVQPALKTLICPTLYVTYGGVSTSPKARSLLLQDLPPAAGSNSCLSINQTLAVNQTMQFDVYANIASYLVSKCCTDNFFSSRGTTALSGVLSMQTRLQATQSLILVL